MCQYTCRSWNSRPFSVATLKQPKSGLFSPGRSSKNLIKMYTSALVSLLTFVAAATAFPSNPNKAHTDPSIANLKEQHADEIEALQKELGEAQDLIDEIKNVLKQLPI